MSQLDTQVLIVGSGSTGLLLAQGLRSAGIPFRIVERHSSTHASREWSMSLHWGAEFLQSGLPEDLRKRLDEINVDPEHDFSAEKGFVQCNGKTGEVLLVMPGVMPRRVSRRKLRNLMSTGLDIEYEKALTGFTVNEGSSSVTAMFSDGSQITSAILVGCDGSRSKVRELMVDDLSISAPKQTPYTIFNFPYTYDANTAAKIREIHPVFKVSYHPTLNMMYMSSVLDANPGKGGDGAVTFQNLISWSGPPYPEDLSEHSTRVQRFKELGAQFAAPYAAAAGAVPDDFDGIFVDRGYEWDPRGCFTVEQESVTDGEEVKAQKSSRWNGHDWKGLVTVAGDAAHAMLPHRGQGLNNALEDAARLASALSSSLGKDADKSLHEAITAYEIEMTARGGLEVEITGRAAMAAHNWEMLMKSPMFKHGANKVK